MKKWSVAVGGYKVGQQELGYMDKALKSSRLSYGPLTREFEKRFAALHDSKFAVFCNSGTSALQVALQALKEKYRWKDGDEVLVPALTFVATANIVLHNRMVPRFCDVTLDDFGLDVQYWPEGPAIKAAIPVHVGGLPCDIDDIRHQVRGYGLRMIEDSCETMFAGVNGKSVGSWGSVGCFSTYMAHILTTGVGGLCTTSDPDLAVRIRSLMNHGRDSIYLDIDKRGKEVMERRFRFTSVGHSFRATEMEAALGLGQLDRWEKIVQKRRDLRGELMSRLISFPVRFQASQNGRTMTPMFFPIIAEGHKKKLTAHLESRGIETRDLLPLINQPIYRKMFGNLDKQFPNAAYLNKHAFYIGCHTEMTLKDCDYVAEIFDEYYRGKR